NAAETRAEQNSAARVMNIGSPLRSSITIRSSHAPTFPTRGDRRTRASAWEADRSNGPSRTATRWSIFPPVVCTREGARACRHVRFGGRGATAVCGRSRPVERNDDLTLAARANLMVWTPRFSTGIEMPKWSCKPTTFERERHHEDYDDWDRFGKNG